MGYCTSCGAYIPDGQTKCLACGFDENAEKEQKTTGSAASASAASVSAAQQAPRQERTQHKYRQFDSDTLRRQLDEQRKRQQENSRKWAETEYAQRQKAKEEQTRNFTNTSRTSGTNNYTDTVKNTVQSADLSKLMAGMSYVSGLFLVPMLFAKDDGFAGFHAKQGMKLFLAGLIGRIAGSIIGLGWLATLAQIYLAYVGIKNVLDGKRKPLPYIGDWFN